MQRRFYWLGVVLLMALLAFASCESNPSGGEESSGGTTNDRSVYDIELSFTNVRGETIENLTNYLGRKDTVVVSGTAKDDQGNGVNNVNLDFTIVEGPGVLKAISESDTVTNSQGDLSIYYIVTLTNQQPTDVTIMAYVEDAGRDVSDNFTISTKDIELTIDAYPDSQRVPEGDSASAELLVRVRDAQGVGVSGIPVRVERLSGNQQSILTPIYQTDSTGAATSTLTLDPIQQNEAFNIRAYVNVVVTKDLPSKRFEGLSTRASRWAELDKAGGSVSLSGVGGGGKNTFASVLADTASVKMFPITVNIDSVYLWAAPEELLVNQNENDSIMVYAAVFDEDGNGIENLTVNFSIRDSAGTGEPTGNIVARTPTNTNGIASATIYTFQQTGTWYVDASVGGEIYTVKIVVKGRGGITGDLRLSSDTDYIYADDGVSRATIMAVLTDLEGVGIQNGEVRFSCNSEFARISPSRIDTDSSGTATVFLIDRGLATESLWIYATYDSLNLEDSLEFEIREAPAIGSITLQIRETDVFQVSTIDSIEFRAQVLNTNGTPFIEGTTVWFETDNATRATWYTNSDSLDINGYATAFLKPGIKSGAERLRANILTSDNVREYSEWVEVTIEPLGPSRFTQKDISNPDGQEIRTLQPEPAVVYAVVVDTFDNPVDNGWGIILETYNSAGEQVGTVSPQVNTETILDTNGVETKGVIQGEFSPGTSAGRAWLKFSFGLSVQDSMSFEIRSTSPQALALEANTTELAAAETGGNNTANVTATVYDANGNIVEDGTIVFFLMDNFPGINEPAVERPLINRSNGYEAGNLYGLPFDSAMTSSGQARISVSSGQGLGVLRLRAWTYVDYIARDDSVRSTFNDIRVVAGPPAAISLDINSEGIDGGGSMWNVEVSAMITDILNNPVKNGIAVQFITSASNPDSTTPAGIGDDGIFTGNEDEDGLSTPGVANTIMSYHSAQTNRLVDITVQVMPESGQILEATFTDIVLPIQMAAGGLDADPANYYFEEVDPDLYSRHEMYAYVYDGHYHWINNQEVLYSTTRGYYSATSTPNAMTRENRAITGPVDNRPPFTDSDDNGYAMRYLIIPFPEAFPDPRILETTATAEVTIVGYPETSVEPVTITLTHAPEE